MTSCCPRRRMRWSGATGAIARCKNKSTGCARRCRSVHAWHWICGVKPKPKVGNKPFPHSRTVKIFELVSPLEITPPTSTRASACFPPHHPPYSASRGAANAEGGGDGLETSIGVYHGDRRSGT